MIFSHEYTQTIRCLFWIPKVQHQYWLNKVLVFFNLWTGDFQILKQMTYQCATVLPLLFSKIGCWTCFVSIKMSCMQRYPQSKKGWETLSKRQLITFSLFRPNFGESGSRLNIHWWGGSTRSSPKPSSKIDKILNHNLYITQYTTYTLHSSYCSLQHTL